jgi:hypothetical protein
MDVGSRIIADAIKEFSAGVQEIKKLKIMMIEKITSQMLQSEKENRDIWFYKINCKLQLFLLRC